MKLAVIWIFLIKCGLICTDMSPTPKIIGIGVLLIHEVSLHDVKAGVWCTSNPEELLDRYSTPKQFR
jgi:hypothetical protein